VYPQFEEDDEIEMLETCGAILKGNHYFLTKIGTELIAIGQSNSVCTCIHKWKLIKKAFPFENLSMKEKIVRLTNYLYDR
jgi:hypothetical protein